MTAWNRHPGGRALAWLLATTLAVLLAACKVKEEAGAPDAATTYSMSAGDVAVISLPAADLPAGATVDWSVQTSPLGENYRLLYPATDTTVQLWAPRTGNYILVAAIHYQGRVLKKRVQVTAHSFTGMGLTVKVGQIGSFTLPASAIPAGTSAFEWFLRKVPDGGSGTLLPNNDAFDFSASSEGEYQVAVAMNVNGVVYYRIVHVFATSYSKLEALAFDPVDARYSQSQDLLLLLDKNSATLQAYSVANDTLTAIALPYAGNTLAVSEDGLHAAVSHDGHVSLVDLATLAVTKTLVTHSPPYSSLVLSNAGVAVAAPLSSGWTYFDTIDFGANTVTSGSTLPWPSGPGQSVLIDGEGVLASAGGRTYFMERGVSPADVNRVEFVGAGAQIAYDSPYHGDHPIGHNFWMYEDGSLLVTGRATTFTVSDTRASDILYSATIPDLSGSYNFLRWFDHSAEAGQFIAIPNDAADITAAVGDTFLQIHDASTLATLGTINMPNVTVGGSSYPSRAVWAFYTGDGSNHVVVVKAKDKTYDDQSTLTHPYYIGVRD